MSGANSGKARSASFASSGVSALDAYAYVQISPGVVELDSLGDLLEANHLSPVNYGLPRLQAAFCFRNCPGRTRSGRGSAHNEEMDETTLRLLTLSCLPGFGPRRVASLLRDNCLDEFYRAPRRFEALVGAEALQALENGGARKEAENLLKGAARTSQTIVALGSPHYPKALSAIYDPPPILFFRGTIAEGIRRVAIVGSRGATSAGRTFARDLSRGLVAHGIEVVSGLARGIDGASHEGALAGHGTTLAVLGSGVDVIYPGEHLDLASRIERSGAVISEQPPGTKPAPGQFPRRNRIIVGLSEAVIVVEAGIKSGALITARVGLEEGREVLAVPGRPCDPLSKGPNLLIRDGATLVQEVDDVLEYLGIGSSGQAPQPKAQDEILKQLAHSAAKSVDQLALDTGLAASALMARLCDLELQGKVERLPGALFRGASPA